MTASVLLRVTIVGFDTTLLLFCCFNAETITLKSEEEKTAEAKRFVEPEFVRPIRELMALVAELFSVLATASVMVRPVVPVVPLLVAFVVPLAVLAVVPLALVPLKVLTLVNVAAVVVAGGPGVYTGAT